MPARRNETIAATCCSQFDGSLAWKSPRQRKRWSRCARASSRGLTRPSFEETHARNHGFRMRDDCATGSISEFAEPVELLGCAGRCSCTRSGSCTCTCAGSCTCAPLFTSVCAPSAPVLAPLVPSCTPILAPLHASGLGLGIGYCQCGSGCCDGEGSSLSEKRKSRSTRDRFRFDDFTHGQNSAWWMTIGMQFQSGRIDLNQAAKALTPVHAGRGARAPTPACPSAQAARRCGCGRRRARR